MVEPKQYSIVVWLTSDYSKSDEFTCEATLTREQITELVNAKYPIWHYFDIW